MAGAGGKDDDLGDVYELLGVEEEAGEKEINAGFRKGSLKCHPDRNPDDPKAAERFDQLSRAKELLLDPVRRGEYDRKKKAKRELQERFSQEDEKRRKLREKLEGSEAAASAKSTSSAAKLAEARQRFAQADLAARIRAKEAELASRQAEVVSEVTKARGQAEEAAQEGRVRVRWRDVGTAGSAAKRAESIKKALSEFGLRTIALEGELEALVQLDSREDALRALLSCRERRHQLGFRVMLEKVSEKAPEKAPPRVPARAAPAPEETAGAPPTAAPAGKAGFDDWEAKMLASLQGLAEAQKKSQPAC